MFTGIVQSARPVSSIKAEGASARIVIDLGAELCAGLQIGASVAVDGVCLTARQIKGTEVAFDVIQGTLERTTLSGWKPGRQANVERSLVAGGEIGGHEISGHVDCRATVKSVTSTPGNAQIAFVLPPEWVRYVFPHGFVAVNGVSLTVNDISRDEGVFSVWLIPETLQRTNLSGLVAGGQVNIEIHRATQVMVDTVRMAVAESLAAGKKEGKRTMTKKVVVVAANYHRAVDRMMEEVTKAKGLDLGQVKTVTGAWELPLAVKRALENPDVAGVIALGAIERGETGHGVAIARAVFPALTQLGLEYDKPVALGIIGPEASLEQIEARATPVALEAVRAMQHILNEGDENDGVGQARKIS
jgi:riboflavin synthase